MQYNEESGNPFLPVDRLLEFLDWLHRDRTCCHLTLGVALQGLSGLQLQEAVRLTWDKVDLEEGTIVIDGSVKNRFQVRQIPVAGVVQWLLNESRKLRGASDYVIREYVDFNGYSKAVSKQLQKWDPDVQIKPKDLRNTIQTAAIDGGWYGYYVQRYVGHSPQTIGERHYFGGQGKRLVPLYREKVVARIEEEIHAWQPVRNPQLELRLCKRE